MKGLLHSKRFRKNLSRWLFMYAGVMLLLTTVVTYSKYMTSKMGTNDARAAKFVVDVESVGDNNIKYRPTSYIEKEFIVDLTGLEVTTYFELTIKKNENFNLVSMEEVTNTLSENACNTKSSDENSILLCGVIPADGKEKRLNYKFILKYDYTKGDLFETYKGQNYDIIKVEWSAIQLT